MKAVDLYKKSAAEKAVDFIQDGMIIGLGSGTTIKFALNKIAHLIKTGKLKDIQGIPSSKKTEGIAKKLGIPLTSLDKEPLLDITIDGADEVDPQLNLIKGAGGALLREKILILASKRVIIAVDETKLSKKLGTHKPVPLEVLAFAVRPETLYLKSIKARPTLRMKKSGVPFKSDQNNLIIDADFGMLRQPEELATRLSQRPGILAYGLFLELATDVIVAGKKGISHLKRFEVL